MRQIYDEKMTEQVSIKLKRSQWEKLLKIAALYDTNHAGAMRQLIDDYEIPQEGS